MNIIVVDDEPIALKNMNEKLLYISEIEEITLFDEPQSALNYLKEHSVDIAFLDIEMYDMSGLEFALLAKNILPNINIIFVTGYSEYAVDAFSIHASGYLLKPVTVERIKKEIENLRTPITLKPKNRIFIHTFGNFEVFVDKKPLIFSRAKSKELLAYLVDRKGTSVTIAEIAAVLWEDREYNRSLQNQTQTVILNMMKTMKDANIEHIIVKKWNSIAVDITKFDCDYYNMLTWDMMAVNTYSGEYMTNYSWAELTTGMLYQKTFNQCYCER